MAASTTIMSRTQKLLKKLSHPLSDVRNRALENVHFKLTNGLLLKSDIIQDRDAMNALLDWVNRTAASSENEVDENNENSGSVDENGTRTLPLYALQLLNTLSREKVSAQYLLNKGAVDSLQNLRKSDNCPEHFYTIIDEVIGSLLARPLVGDTMNAKLPGDVNLSMKNVEFEEYETVIVTDFDKKGKKRTSWQETDLASTKIQKSKMIRPLSLKGGWRFPIISLVRSDESALFDVQAQLRVADDQNIANACKTISGFAAHDFPCEIFLQRPDILHGLLGQISLPGMVETNGDENEISNTTSSFENHGNDPTLNAIDALNTIILRLKARLKVYLDSDAYTAKSATTSKSFPRGIDPGIQEADLLSNIDINNTSALGESLAMSLGYASMVIFISCLPALKTGVSFPVRKLLLNVITLLPERFPYMQKNSKGFSSVVTSETLDCARIERCLEALNRVVASRLIRFLNDLDANGNDGEESMDTSVTTGHLCDINIIVQILNLVLPKKLVAAGKSNDIQQNRAKSSNVFVPAQVITILRMFIQNERLSSTQPDILKKVLPIMKVLDPVSCKEYFHGRKVIGIINRMKNVLEMDEEVVASAAGTTGTNTKQHDDDQGTDLIDLIHTMQSGSEISTNNKHLQERFNFLQDSITALQYKFENVGNLAMIVSQVVGLSIGLGRLTANANDNGHVTVANKTGSEYKRAINLLLKLLSHPQSEIQGEAYSQLTVALDGNLLYASDKLIGDTNLMEKSLFCVALNPEILFETFAHGMTSTNDSVQTFAITFMRNVIARAMKFSSAAVKAMIPFQLYLQAYAYHDSRHSSDTDYVGGKSAVQSSLPEAISLIGLLSSQQSRASIALNLVRKLMHAEKWVRHTASIELRDFVRHANRFLSATETLSKHRDKYVEDPVSAFDTNGKPLESVDCLQDGYSAASVAFAVDDISRFTDLLSNSTTQGDIWRTGAVQCASILSDKRVVDECMGKNANMLSVLCKVCIERLAGNNEIEHFGALQVIYICTTQSVELCRRLFSSASDDGFSNNATDNFCMHNLNVLSAFIFHANRTFITLTLSIFSHLCFQPNDLFCYSLRADTCRDSEMKNVHVLSKIVDKSERNAVSNDRLVGLNQLEPLKMPNAMNEIFPLDKLGANLNINVFHFKSVNSTSNHWELGFQPNRIVQKMVTASIQRSIVTDRTSDQMRDDSSTISLAIELLNDISSSSSHRSCTNALETFYHICEINSHLLENASRATWYESFRRFLETSPSSRKDEFLLSKVVKCITKMASSMNASAKIMALIALRDRLVPLLSVYLHRGNKMNYGQSKKDEFKIPGTMIETLRGTGYGLSKNFLDGVKITNSSYHTVERQALVKSILELTLALCYSENSSENDTKTQQELKYSLLFETNLISVLAHHIALCNHRDLGTVRLCVAIVNGMISGISTGNGDINQLITPLAAISSLFTQIAQVHRIPGSYIGRAVFREAILGIEQLAALGFDVGVDFTWCRRLLMDHEVYVRVCGYNIITQIFAKQYDNDNVAAMLAKEPIHDSVPQIIQQSWACAVDKKEPFVVRASAMHVVRGYFIFACMSQNPTSVNFNAEKNLGLQSFVALSILQGLSEILSNEAVSSCALSNSIAQLLVTLDGAFSMLEGLDDEWLANRISNYDLWQPLLEMINPRMHWDGYIRNIERNFAGAANTGYATIDIPEDIEASFHKHGYVFNASNDLRKRGRNSNGNSILTENTLNDIYHVWRRLYSDASISCGGLIMHLAKRSLQINSSFCENQLEEMSPLVANTLEHFFALSRKYFFTNDSSTAIIMSNADKFTLIQTILTLVNEVSKGAECPVNDNNINSKASMSLTKQFEKSLEFCLGADAPDALRFVSSILLSTIVTNAKWASLLSDMYIGKRPNYKSKDFGPSSIPEGSALLKTLIEFYLSRHSSIDLGFNDALGSGKSNSNIFVSWEQTIPPSQQDNVALIYGIRALLERSVYFKEECLRCGLFDFVLNRIDELHDLMVLETMHNKPKSKSNKTQLATHRELVLNAQAMGCFGIFESLIYRSSHANQYAWKHGGLRIIMKNLTYADAREVNTAFMEHTSLLGKILCVLINTLSTGGGLIKSLQMDKSDSKTISSYKMKKNYSSKTNMLDQFKKIIHKVTDLAIFFGNYAAPNNYDARKVWEMMRICYGIISNAAVSNPKTLKLIVRSGFLDKNFALLETILSKTNHTIRTGASRSVTPRSTPSNSRPNSPTGSNNKNTNLPGLIVIPSSNLSQQTKRQITKDKNVRFENIMNMLIRITTTKYGSEVVGKHKQTMDCVFRKAFEKTKTMLLLRNIALVKVNKAYFTSNPLVLNKIVNKLVDDNSDAELQTAAHAAACVFAIVNNNEKGKAIVKHGDVQGKIVQAKRRAEENIQFQREKEWQYYRLNCLNEIMV
jgi:hypothetical protein